MRNKPIKEGSKFFAMCFASCGYVFAFGPSGRDVKNVIVNTATSLASTLPQPDEYQYLITMDNYLTTSRAIAGVGH